MLILQFKTFKSKMKWQPVLFSTLGTGAKSDVCSFKIKILSVCFTHIGGCCGSPGSLDFFVLLSFITRDHSEIISR